MKTRFALLALVALAMTGCATRFELPNVSGDSVTYHRTDPLGGTKIEATGVEVTDTEVRAETASWTTSYPQFSVTLTVKNYRREKKQ